MSHAKLDGQTSKMLWQGDECGTSSLFRHESAQSNRVKDGTRNMPLFHQVQDHWMVVEIAIQVKSVGNLHTLPT